MPLSGNMDLVDARGRDELLWRRIATIRESLATTRSLPLALEMALTEARTITGAEAGTIYLRDVNLLHVFVAQNDVLSRRVGEAAAKQRLMGQPVPLDRCSLAGYVAVTGTVLNVADAYRIDPACDYLFDSQFDAANFYRTRSVLAVVLADHDGTVHGVLQLINARDSVGRPVAFGPQHEQMIEALARDIGETVGVRTSSGSAARNGGSAAGPSGHVAGAHDAPRAGAAPSRPVVRRLGELVITHGLISPVDLESALAEQKRTHARLGSILVRRNLIDEQRLADFLSRQYGVPAVAPAQLVPDPDLLSLVAPDIALKHEVLPVDRNGQTLTLAMGDPNNFAALDDIAFATGLQVVATVAPLSPLRKAIERAYQVPGTETSLETDTSADELEIVDEEEPGVDLAELRTSADQAPVVRLVNALLVDGIRRGASDIHIEPGDKSFKVRFRVDGLLQHLVTRAKRLEAAVVSRIKIMANLDISERRRAQDGHIKLRCDGREVDLRVSVLPSILGEAVVIRILDRAAIQFDLTQLGFDDPGLVEFDRAIRGSHGMILITGPTGSGKTTTLYAALRKLTLPEVKILTIEDPVEYEIEGVTQVEVNEAANWTFPIALRSFLRHDPDVVLVGEIRDLETAQVAVRAALTGHLVCSTLHTNDCPSTIARLVDMGIPGFLVSYAVRTIVAQRLGRRLCPRCRIPYEVDEARLVPYGFTPSGRGRVELYRAGGCEHCRFTGMKGRVGFFQVMTCSEEIRRLVMEQAGRDEIESVARGQGMRSLREVGLDKALAGITTVEEVLRVTAD